MTERETRKYNAEAADVRRLPDIQAEIPLPHLLGDRDKSRFTAERLKRVF